MTSARRLAVATAVAAPFALLAAPSVYFVTRWEIERFARWWASR